MDYLVFEKLIAKRATYILICCLIVAIICICGMIFSLRNIKHDKPMHILLILLCTSAIIGSFVLGSNVLYKSIYDIKNHAYVTYEGDFIVESDIETRSGTCTLYIPYKEGIKLETDAHILDPGEYHGKIIYGEKTKIVLSISETQHDNISKNISN